MLEQCSLFRLASFTKQCAFKFPPCLFMIFVKGQLTILWDYIYGILSFLFCSIDLAVLFYLFIFLLTSHYLGYCSFTVSFEAGRTLFYNIVLAAFILMPLLINFTVFSYPVSNLLIFWFVFHQIYTSCWEKLLSWQYWAFLSMSMGYLFI